MIEIKFRVFTKEDGLCDVIEIDFDNKNVEYILNDFDDSASVKFNKCKLLQYTGLKDKNGVEIYEGDIVRIFGLNRTVEVFFKKGSFGYLGTISESFVSFSENYNFNFLENKSNKIEVIGNIYENKELLDER